MHDEAPAARLPASRDRRFDVTTQAVLRANSPIRRRDNIFVMIQAFRTKQRIEVPEARNHNKYPSLLIPVEHGREQAKRAREDCEFTMKRSIAPSSSRFPIIYFGENRRIDIGESLT